MVALARNRLGFLARPLQDLARVERFSHGSHRLDERLEEVGLRRELVLGGLVAPPLGDDQVECECRGRRDRRGKATESEPYRVDSEAEHGQDRRDRDGPDEQARPSRRSLREAHAPSSFLPGLDGPAGKAGMASRSASQATPQSMIASRSAIATACVRVSASSFVRMWRTWLLTVSWLMKRRPATSALDIPSASSCRISRSLPVSISSRSPPRKAGISAGST